MQQHCSVLPMIISNPERAFALPFCEQRAGKGELSVAGGLRLIASGRYDSTAVKSGAKKAERDGVKIVAQNRLGTGKPLDFGASPAVANGRLFLRSQSHLYCIGEERKSASR